MTLALSLAAIAVAGVVCSRLAWIAAAPLREGWAR